MKKGTVQGGVMTEEKMDPTEPIREKARSYPDVVEGTSCTQTSFKIGKKAFLYIGMQGGRFKAMFKLDASIPEAAGLAEEEPDCYQIGKIGWLTARFTAEKPIPKMYWEKWLQESYNLMAVKPKKKSRKSPSKV